MLVVGFADLEIGSAAERYRASMAKYLPKPFRTLYRGGRDRAVNGFTSSNAAINEIESNATKKVIFCHSFARCLRAPEATRISESPATEQVDDGAALTILRRYCI
jgi:hypothetical protein